MLRPAWAICSAACALSKVAWADPVDVPTAALPRPSDGELTWRLRSGGVTVPDGATSDGPADTSPTIPTRPLPRLLLQDPLRAQPPRFAISGGPSFAAAASGAAGASTALDPSWLPDFADAPSPSATRGPSPQISWDQPTGPIFLPLAPHDPYEPAPSSAAPAAAATPSPVVDDRSGWARWNASLVGVSATVLAFDAVMVAAFTLLPTEVTGWHEPEFNGLKKNFTEGPRVDNDRFVFNYVAHPLAGSEYYLIARNRDLNWWQSMAYSTALSTAFEFLIESTYEQASWQDLWITPVSGTALGELRWQVKKALENPTTGKPVGTLNKILYVVIDPFDAVYKL
jgi:hypothetical protein